MPAFRHLFAAASLAAVLAGCGTSFDLSSTETIAALDVLLEESDVGYETVEVVDAARETGDIVSVEGLPDGASLESVADGTDGLVVTVVNNDQYEMPDLIGMPVGEARRTLEDLLGDLTPALRNVDVWEPGVPDGEMSEVKVGGGKVKPGDVVPIDEAVQLLHGSTKNLRGEYVLDVPARDLLAEEAPSSDGGTSALWEYRDGSWEGDFCSGKNGYDDVRAGFNLTLRDANGTVVSTASLTEGRGVWEGPDEVEFVGQIDWDCKFTFIFSNVPASPFYEVTSNRGTLTYDFNDLNRSGTVLTLTLGNE